MTDLFSPLSFTRGPAMKNRFMMAPMTNQQGYPDGRLSDEEYYWLTKNFPERVRLDPNYDSPPLPVTAEHLLEEGLTGAFIAYMQTWPGFVAEDGANP